MKRAYFSLPVPFLPLANTINDIVFGGPFPLFLLVLLGRVTLSLSVDLNFLDSFHQTRVLILLFVFTFFFVIY